MIDKISVIIITNKLNEKKKKPNKTTTIEKSSMNDDLYGFEGCVEKQFVYE